MTTIITLAIKYLITTLGMVVNELQVHVRGVVVCESVRDTHQAGRPIEEGSTSRGKGISHVPFHIERVVNSTHSVTRCTEGHVPTTPLPQPHNLDQSRHEFAHFKPTMAQINATILD